MTKLEIAKSIKRNNYSCTHLSGTICCDMCPINLSDGCGNSDPLGVVHSKRIQLIDDYIAKHENENTMTELQKLEKAIEEHRKAGEELKRQFEEFKIKQEKIVFDGNANWGLISHERRYILSSNGSTNTKVEWKSFHDCECTCTGAHDSGQEAIDNAIALGGKVVKLARGREAVACFLLGKDT